MRVRAAVAWLRTGLRHAPYWHKLVMFSLLVSSSRVVYDGGQPGFRPHPPTHPAEAVLTFVLGGAVLAMALARAGHMLIDADERRADTTKKDRP